MFCAIVATMVLIAWMGCGYGFLLEVALKMGLGVGGKILFLLLAGGLFSTGLGFMYMAILEACL